MNVLSAQKALLPMDRYVQCVGVKDHTLCCSTYALHGQPEVKAELRLCFKYNSCVPPPRILGLNAFFNPGVKGRGLAPASF